MLVVGGWDEGCAFLIFLRDRKERREVRGFGEERILGGNSAVRCVVLVWCWVVGRFSSEEGLG